MPENKGSVSESSPLLEKSTKSRDEPSLSCDGESASDKQKEITTTGLGGEIEVKDDTETKEKGFKFSNLTRRNKYVLICTAMANFLAGAALSLLNPFYPLEAEKKGMTPTVVGVVFSVFEAVIFVTSPFLGNYLTKIGAKFMYLSGIFVGGFCIILFGTLDKCPSGTPFIVTSIVCRSVEALGISAFITAGLAIVSSEFSEAVGTVFGIIETFFGIGMMIGPVIGGALYELGGYGVPFYVMGTLVLLNGVFMYACLPEPKDVQVKEKKSIFGLLKSPMVIITITTIFVGFFALNATGVNLAKHLDTFDVSTVVIGLLFMIVPCLYALSAPVCGFLTDSKDVQGPLIVFGHFMFGLGFLLIGPTNLLPFIPFELWVVILGLACVGSSVGCLMIPTMKCMAVGARELSKENSLDTHGMVSGLFNSANSLGGLVGATAGSAVVERYGYPTGFTVFGGSNIIMAVVTCGFFFLRHFKRKRKSGIEDSESGGDACILATGSPRTETANDDLEGLAKKDSW